jgi:hypothetical protein
VDARSDVWVAIQPSFLVRRIVVYFTGGESKGAPRLDALELLLMSGECGMALPRLLPSHSKVASPWNGGASSGSDGAPPTAGSWCTHTRSG